jgi:hypothetical protein
VIKPIGRADQYSYQYNDLTGAGDVFIPIIDPSALVVSSLPSNVTVISDLATIEAGWPGAGNFVPANEPVFDLPPELLEVPENGAFSLDFSFLDTDLPVDGPILADGTLITDPPVPGLQRHSGAHDLGDDADRLRGDWPGRLLQGATATYLGSRVTLLDRVADLARLAALRPSGMTKGLAQARPWRTYRLYASLKVMYRIK